MLDVIVNGLFQTLHEKHGTKINRPKQKLVDVDVNDVNVKPICERLGHPIFSSIYYYYLYINFI